MPNVVHKHMIMRAEVNEPLITPTETKKWLRDLVKKIDMKILGGPVSYTHLTLPTILLV